MWELLLLIGCVVAMPTLVVLGILWNCTRHRRKGS